MKTSTCFLLLFSVVYVQLSFSQTNYVDPTYNCEMQGNFNRATINWENPQALIHINSETDGEGYPCLTPDGLRLYYVYKNELYVCSRASLAEEFSHKKKVDMVKTGYPSIVSGWFSNDELEVYYATYSELYFASRSDKNGKFGEPQRIDLGDFKTTFNSGVSLTPDKSELYLYSADDNGILQFKKTGTLQYQLVGKIAPFDGFVAGAGQVSKNGLSYYVSLEKDAASLIFKLSRRSQNEPWGNLTEISNSLCMGGNKLIQPSVSADEKTMTWVTNSKNRWEYNDIQISYTASQNPVLETTANVSQLTETVTSDETETIVAQENFISFSSGDNHSILLYPNPSNSQITLAVGEMNGEANLSIMDINGKEIFKRTITQNQTEVDVSQFSSGIYFAKFMQGERLEIIKFIKE